MDELDLMVACKSGDEKAQFKLYKKYYSFLMSICLRYKKDQQSAEGVLNMGFFKIITKLDSYNVNIPFTAWMHRIMINTIIDEYRKEKKHKEIFEYNDNYLLLSDQNISGLNEADLKFEAEELLQMIKSLPNITQQVFNLFAIDGYKHKDISILLEMEVGTSRWHLSMARKLLKEMLNKKMSNNKTAKYGG